MENTNFQPSLICQEYAEYAATAIKDSDLFPGLAQEKAQFDETIQTPLQVLIEPISAGKINNGGQPRKDSKIRNETQNSFDVFTTKKRLKVKISKSSKVQHCQNKTERVQILYKGMKEPSKHPPTSTEIQKIASKSRNENKNFFDSTTKSKLKVKILRSSKVQHCQNKIGRGEIMLMFEFQSMKFGPIYAKDINESKAVVNLAKLKVKEQKFRDKHLIKSFGLVLIRNGIHKYISSVISNKFKCNYHISSYSFLP